MKTLLERLNFSIKKPQEDKKYIAFKLKANSSSPTYGMFLHLCGQANANLYYIEDTEINKCLGVFTAFDKKAKQEMERKSLNCLVCFFWLDGE